MGATKAQFVLHEAAQLQSPLKSSKPVLYTHTLCPYAQRVFLTMLLKVSKRQGSSTTGSYWPIQQFSNDGTVTCKWFTGAGHIGVCSSCRLPPQQHLQSGLL